MGAGILARDGLKGWGASAACSWLRLQSEGRDGLQLAARKNQDPGSSEDWGAGNEVSP